LLVMPNFSSEVTVGVDNTPCLVVHLIRYSLISGLSRNDFSCSIMEKPRL
jgi:hypothetical protein